MIQRLSDFRVPPGSVIELGLSRRLLTNDADDVFEAHDASSMQSSPLAHLMPQQNGRPGDNDKEYRSEVDHDDESLLSYDPDGIDDEVLLMISMYV